MKKAIILFLALSFLPIELLAWGQKGHRVIAEVAYHYMNSGARRKVDKVLGRHGMVYWANWPDEIKSDTIYPDSFDWHFQDMPGGMTDSAIVATLTDYPASGGSLFRVTDSLLNRLRHDRTEVDNLRFIVHFAGDRYCPMHLGHPEDYGGNRCKFSWFGQKSNIHQIWDSKLIESQGYSYTEYAAYLIDTYDYRANEVKHATDAELLLQTYHLVEEIYAYYNHGEGDTSPYHYMYRFHQPMEWQLFVAGVRLANWMNELYK